MPESRRKFLALTAGGLAGIAGIAVAPAAADTLASLPEPPPTPPGTPPAFGTAPAVGPEISVQTVAEAEKLVSPVTVETRSGETLKVYFESQEGNFKNVYLEGKAKLVYEGVIEG